MNPKFDIIVIGGGHAGAEAACAASKLGARTAMITTQFGAIARMSCNPAIGGLGKGQMVREIDAMGGLMGLATDRAGIQFRLLNRSKGPAVWAPRAQCDRDLYPRAIQDLLSELRNLEFIEGLVEKIHIEDITHQQESSAHKRVVGLTLKDGRRFDTSAIIITTGTFLRGLMHCGEEKKEGGRISEPAAVGLSASLKDMGLELGRLKTGTPPRIHRDTINYDACEIQPGDEIPKPFSELTDGITQKQICCWITWTNTKVHELITANLHRAPMYTGQIQSTGPRYCPSIEDKVVRFSDKPRHQIFLEPEGLDHERVYCNGISTSLPKEVQDEMIQGITGLENAKIVQHGYAVEYDFVPTHQTKLSLETKPVEGLYLAGQINGTSGYEEAAAQGLMAGINAVRKLNDPKIEPFTLGRDQAYIGVMIDDLMTKPPTEPYRMFTSRAEYRLRLRSDNADQRLTPIGRELGLVDDHRWERYQNKMEAMEEINRRTHWGSVNDTPIRVWMRRPESDAQSLADVICHDYDRVFCIDVLEQVLIEAKYSGYIERQARQIERFRKLETMSIPSSLNYASMHQLRHEARENLTRVTPSTLGQASRITGINPSDITVLWVYLTGRKAG